MVDSTTPTIQYLREAGCLSAIAAVFTDARRKVSLTLAQVLWEHEEQIRELYAVAPACHSLQDLVEGHANPAEIRRAARRAGWQIDDFVFTSQAGTMIKPDNIARRYMNPALAKAGLRRFRFHDLRHTFGSLLIQDGASLAYVKDQMGHSSIQVTVDVYGHLVPSANIACVDRLDTETRLQQVRTRDAPSEEGVRAAVATSS